MSQVNTLRRKSMEGMVALYQLSGLALQHMKQSDRIVLHRVVVETNMILLRSSTAKRHLNGICILHMNTMKMVTPKLNEI